MKKHLEVESQKTLTKTAFSKGLDPIAMHATLLNAHITDILKSNVVNGSLPNVVNGSLPMSSVPSLGSAVGSKDFDYFNKNTTSGPTNKNGRARSA